MILKSTHKDTNQSCTTVVPDTYQDSEIKYLHALGYRNIHNPKTGIVYSVCGNNHVYSVGSDAIIDPCDIPF